MGVFKDHCKPNHQCRLVMILISPMYTHQTSELERPTVDTEPHLVQEVWSVWWWYPGSCPGLHCHNQPSSAICCPSHPTLALHNNQTWNAITREREREIPAVFPPSFLRTVTADIASPEAGTMTGDWGPLLLVPVLHNHMEYWYGDMLWVDLDIYRNNKWTEQIPICRINILCWEVQRSTTWNGLEFVV